MTLLMRIGVRREPELECSNTAIEFVEFGGRTLWAVHNPRMLSAGLSKSLLEQARGAASEGGLRLYQYLPAASLEVNGNNSHASNASSSNSSLILRLLCAKHAICVNSLCFLGLTINIICALMATLVSHIPITKQLAGGTQTPANIPCAHLTSG
ncbi:hypothetical protein BJV78DRAFT_1186533 [Lactifluus subvellereus]|nr:hypothetical protein BJV78DRAFT_1186533 [Lactifluus subvellereus]